MKKGIFALIVIVLVCLSCGRKSNTVKQELKWIEYHTKNSLPSAVLNSLGQLINERFEIADFNQPYRASDVDIGDGLPTRQLRYIGKNGAKWQMVYQHGGVGVHYHFIDFELKSGDVFIRNIGTSLSHLDSRRQIDSALASKKVELHSPGADDAKDL